MLCFRKHLVAKKCKDKKRGVKSQFFVEIFFLTVPKYFVEEPFCAVFQKISGGEKVYGEEQGGEHHIFPSKSFFSQFRKIS